MISEQVQAEGRCVDIESFRQGKVNSRKPRGTIQGAAVVSYSLTHTMKVTRGKPSSPNDIRSGYG